MTEPSLRIVAQDTDPNSDRKPARLVLEGPEGNFAIADLIRKVLHERIPLSTFQRHGTWYRVEENQLDTLSRDFTQFHRATGTEPSTEAIGNFSVQDSSWLPGRPNHTLEFLAAEYVMTHSSHPFRVFVIGRKPRGAEQIASRLVSAMSVQGTFHGSVWTRNALSLPCRTVVLGHDRIDQRRFESATVDAVVLSGAEEPDDLPVDWFGRRRGFAVIGGIHSQSAVIVDKMLKTNPSAVYLADPVTGHTWQVGENEPHLDVIVECIKTLYQNPKAKSRALNLYRAALTGLVNSDHKRALTDALVCEKIQLTVGN